MKVKERYSLCLEQILNSMPTIEKLPSTSDNAMDIQNIRHQCDESLNVFQAFADYLVERNNTRELIKRIDATKKSLDVRNYEAERQSKIIIDNYAVRLKNFVAKKRQEFELETQRLELESVAQVEAVQNAVERQRRKISAQIKLIEFYRSLLEDAQIFLVEIEDNPEQFVTRNKFYYQVREDRRVKSNYIRKLLNDLDK